MTEVKIACVLGCSLIFDYPEYYNVFSLAFLDNGYLKKRVDELEYL